MTESPKDLIDTKTASQIKLMEAGARIQNARITLFVVLGINVAAFMALLYAIFVEKATDIRAMIASFEALAVWGFRYVLKNLFPSSEGKKWWEVVFGTRRIENP